MSTVQKAVVLGAGTMGRQIAAHLANARIQTHLLDMVPAEANTDPSARNQLAEKALQNLQSTSPSPLFEPDRMDLITPGNIEDHLSTVADADWVIEAVIEQLEPKQQLWKQVEKHWSEGTWVSTNTSGLSVNAISRDCSNEFRRHFFGSHFFNPPRYMELLELIPTDDTDPAIVKDFHRFATTFLGKEVVVARDTPNFIANRLGIFATQATLDAMIEFGFDIDTVDAITGRAMGHAKSATFRTLDLVGVDVFLDVVKNLRENTDEADRFEVPPFVKEMAERGWIGEKAGQGFFKKETTGSGSQIYTLDPQTMEYKPRNKPELDAGKQALSEDDPAGRLRTLIASDDDAGRFSWTVTKRLLLYAAEHASQIAPGLESIDRAMRYGFNWDLGPFEQWDALGLPATVERMKADGETIPDWIKEMLESGRTAFYDGDTVVSPGGGVSTGQQEPVSDRSLTFPQARQHHSVIASNDGATLIDAGDGVAALYLHGPKDSIGQDILEMIDTAAEEVSTHYRGLVLSQAGEHFAVGANLMLILMLIRSGDWDQLEQAVRRFQEASMTLKYLDRPVVAAPAGRALGGGAEFCLHSDRIQAAAETYMGLVEAGVGLIPAGGGTKELLIRAMEHIPQRVDADRQPYINLIFETIGTAKVSTSGEEARALGFLRSEDRISMNKQQRIWAAKETVLHLDRLGYRPPLRTTVPVTGRSGRAVLDIAAYHMRNAGQASEHDQVVAGHLSRVLTGGDVPGGSEITEQHLLDLEREAFLSLCGEEKTQQRIEHMLTTGKPLRN